jgi:hypothetical protein
MFLLIWGIKTARLAKAGAALRGEKFSGISELE